MGALRILQSAVPRQACTMRQPDISSSTSSGGSQVIQKASLLMRLIAAERRTGLRLVDVYRSTGLERPTAHRLLQSLVAERLLRQEPENRRYFPGPAMYELGLAASPPQALRDVCHPYLRQIVDATGNAAFLVERFGLDGVCTSLAEGSTPIHTFVMDLGKKRPLTVGGAATAMLSAMADVELDRLCQANYEDTVRRFPRYSETHLRDNIRSGRLRGFVMSTVLDLPYMRSVAVPIRDSQGIPLAAISVVMEAKQLDGDRASKISAVLRDSVTSIECALA